MQIQKDNQTATREWNAIQACRYNHALSQEYKPAPQYDKPSYTTMQIPEGTTKRCAKCGVESDKPLWVREHSCPLCGYKTDRDHNSSIEVQRLGLEDLGVEFDREELFSESGQSSNIGLGQSKCSGNRTSVRDWNLWESSG